MPAPESCAIAIFCREGLLLLACKDFLGVRRFVVKRPFSTVGTWIVQPGRIKSAVFLINFMKTPCRVCGSINDSTKSIRG
jgi:hypothetical protein